MQACMQAPFGSPSGALRLTPGRMTQGEAIPFGGRKKKIKKKYYTAHWSVLGLRRDISLTVRHVTFNHQHISSNLVYPIKKRGGFGEEVFTLSPSPVTKCRGIQD